MKNNKNQYWRNLKNGKTYQYVGKATDATNGNEGIEYAVYSDGEVLYVRKFKEFTKKFEPQFVEG